MSQQDRAQARRTKIEAIRADDRREATRRKNAVISLSVAGVFVVVLAVMLAVNTSRPDTGAAGESRLVRPDSHRLQVAPDGKVTLVEFLDFQCAGCKAHYPVIERLRRKYAGKITLVVRHFPLAAHINAMPAARAVEAAAQQGHFEAMYRLMYETQDHWGRQQRSAEGVFRGYAKGLGLDMNAWNKAYDDPATLARVQKDAADGEALGVQGTPTFFLNGTKIQPRSEDEFTAAIDAALAR
ncbi:DsbA family protein [Nonomuraea mesophila]|uniref:DsbA family protein n=1 Tax=Nonomuraea mesophila TaxID=2530382 RepID=UPI001FE61DB8|nr:thioredoxin domain-containing protein [Nonomuraea mesophila]